MGKDIIENRDNQLVSAKKKHTTIAIKDATKKRLINFAVYGETIDTVINHVIDLAESKKERVL